MHPRTGLLVDHERRIWELTVERRDRADPDQERRLQAKRWLEKALRSLEVSAPPE